MMINTGLEKNIYNVVATILYTVKDTNEQHFYYDIYSVDLNQTFDSVKDINKKIKKEIKYIVSDCGKVNIKGTVKLTPVNVKCKLPDECIKELTEKLEYLKKQIG